MENPKLRPVQFFPAMIEGKKMGCLHDPQKISPKPLLIPWRYASILPLMDGRHSLLDIKAAYMRTYGDLLFQEDLVSLIQKLDHYLFLDSERFQEFHSKIKTEFLDSPVRPPFFSGLSYPSEPKALLEELTGYFEHENGPSLPSSRHPMSEVTALIAPHIDISSGGCSPTASTTISALWVSNSLVAVFSTVNIRSLLFGSSLMVRRSSFSSSTPRSP